MDIVILRIKYPNDPTNALSAHQHFIGELTESALNIYTVSSILGKEDRVFGNDADDYERIESSETSINGFRVPSFIDCTKMYSIELDDTVNVSNLSTRDISSVLVERIKKRILRKKQEGRHTTYCISTADIKRWNKRICK